MPLKNADIRLEVTALDENTTGIRCTMNFQPKFGPLGWLMANLMMKPMLKKMLRGVFKGLEDHLTTGQRVGQDGKLLAAA